MAVPACWCGEANILGHIHSGPGPAPGVWPSVDGPQSAPESPKIDAAPRYGCDPEKLAHAAVNRAEGLGATHGTGMLGSIAPPVVGFGVYQERDSKEQVARDAGVKARREVLARISEREQDIERMQGYVQLKERERDRHGAIDGLMDIRDTEAEILGMRYVLKTLGIE